MKSQQVFFLLAVGTALPGYPRMTTVPPIRTFFSLTLDTPRSSRYIAYIYGMQQFLYWRIRISVRYTGPHLSTVLSVLAFTDRQSFPAYDRRISELM